VVRSQSRRTRRAQVISGPSSDQTHAEDRTHRWNPRSAEGGVVRRTWVHGESFEQGKAELVIDGGPDGYDVTIVDPSPSMLERAQERAAATGVWLESPGDDLADHVSRAIDLLAAGLTDG
jgi:hypothetical protein